MAAFEDGKDSTFHIYIFRGHKFEILETMELSPDSSHIVRRETIMGTYGEKQIVTIEIPIK